MCTQTERRQRAADLRTEQSNAKVHIEGKQRPLYVADPAESVEGQLLGQMPVVFVTNLRGERTSIPRERVISVVEVKHDQAQKVDVPAEVFWGKRIQVRNLAAYAQERPDTLNGMTLDKDLNTYTVVTGEDLAEAEIVVLDVSDGQVVWVNPACAEAAVAKFVAAAMLLAEAEQIDTLFQEEAVPAAPAQHPVYGQVTEDQANALQHLERGDIDGARHIAGNEFVDRVIAEGNAS